MQHVFSHKSLITDSHVGLMILAQEDYFLVMYLCACGVKRPRMNIYNKQAVSSANEKIL